MQQRNSNTNLAFQQQDFQDYPTKNLPNSKLTSYAQRNPIGYPPEELNNQNRECVKHDQKLSFDDKDIKAKELTHPEDKIEHIGIIQHRKHIQNISPYQHKRLLGCGTIHLMFKSSPKRSPYFTRNHCHSLVCPDCARKDHRKAIRVIKVLGEALIKFCPWYAIVGQIPERFEKKFYLNNESVKKFQSDVYEILIEELGLWKGLERFDRSGGVFSPHFFGDQNPGYNFHVDMMIPAIRDGKPIKNPRIERDEWDKFSSKVKTRMALRMSNDVGEKVSPEEMVFHLDVKYRPEQIARRISYMTRNTIQNGSKDDDGNIKHLFEYFHRESEDVQDYLTNGRIGQNGVTYRGKTAGGELESWYEYLGLNYDERNAGKVKEWLDENGDEIEFVRVITNSELMSNGYKLTRVGNDVYTLDNQKAIDEKFNDFMFQISDIPSSKFLTRKVKEWELMLEGRKINWSKNVIHKCLENNIHVIENSDITTDACLDLIQKEKVNLKRRKTKLENIQIREELFLEAVLSGCNYESFLDYYDKYSDIGTIITVINKGKSDEELSQYKKEDESSRKKWALKEYNKHLSKYDQIESKIGIEQDEENIELFNQYLLLPRTNLYDPGTRESIRDDERKWDKFDIQVGKYLRKNGYMQARKLQKDSEHKRQKYVA